MSYYTNERREVIPFVPRAADRILDVGCASGGFGAALRAERGHQIVVHGIEPNAEAAATARTRLDDVHAGQFNHKSVEILGGGIPYSCIVFNDVLEHMVAPDEALRIARRHLSVGGVVVASIPNFRNWNTLNMILRAGSFRYADKGVLDRTHLRFFCLRDMVELFESADFEVTTTEGISSLNLRNWQRWHLLSRLIGNGLAFEGRFEQFIVVGAATRE